jgi:hypothetical protein
MPAKSPILSQPEISRGRLMEKADAARVPQWASRRSGVQAQAQLTDSLHLCAITSRREKRITGMHGHPQPKAWIRAPPLSPTSAQTRRCADLRLLLHRSRWHLGITTRSRSYGSQVVPILAGACAVIWSMDSIEWQGMQAISCAASQGDQHRSWFHEFVRAVFRCFWAEHRGNNRSTIIWLREKHTSTQERPEDRRFVYVPACSGALFDPPPLACSRRSWHHGLAAGCLHLLYGATSQAAKRTILRSRGRDTTREKHALE